MRLVASRDSALNRLNHFINGPILNYAHERNYDLGGGHENVSCLSPYVSRRLILEQEIIKKVLEKHSYKSVEKFIQEVLWRIYWKGWLEHHPIVWRSYLEDLEDLRTYKSDLYHLAVNGKTGIDCFDHWVKELIDTGYLHNHARMWFASIWIYHLRLPWQLGAKFFYENLLDADVASNTLSWRWVAGLHTIGKKYIATRENIQKYTNSRFNFNDILIKDDLDLKDGFKLVKFCSDLPFDTQPVKLSKFMLLVIEEDLYPESLEEVYSKLENLEKIVVIGTNFLSKEFEVSFSEQVRRFSLFSLNDLKQRLSAYSNNIIIVNSHSELSSLLNQGDMEVVCIRPYVGYYREYLNNYYRDQIKFLFRDIDKDLYKYADKGFFKFKNIIPAYVKDLI